MCIYRICEVANVLHCHCIKKEALTKKKDTGFKHLGDKKIPHLYQ